MMMPIPNGVLTGLNLKELREKNHFTHQELADCLHVTLQATYRWEKGIIPKLDNLAFLAKLYHVTIDDLLVYDYVLITA